MVNEQSEVGKAALDFDPAEEVVYISGPMRGISDFNRPAFEEATARFRGLGFKEVICPIEQDDNKWGGPEEAAANFDRTLGFDLDILCRNATILALLPGWELSVGAQLELRTALTCVPPKRIVCADTLQPIDALDIERYRPRGAVEQFASGAIRSLRTGKGRYDLMPGRALHRVAKLFELGALPDFYTERGWERGIPLSDLLDPAIRHGNEYMIGRRDEDHAVRATWNWLIILDIEERVREGLLPRELLNVPYWTVENSNEQK